MTKTEQLDRLFEEWHANYPCYKDRFMKDGIVNEDLWEKTSQKKLLFLLKEPNDNYYRNLPIEKQNKYKDDIRKMLNDEPWKEIGCFSYGLQNTTNTYIPNYEDAEKNIAEACKQSAVMNLKKLPGKGSSDPKDIEEFVDGQKEEIEKEIQIISPCLIVLGGVGDIIKGKFPNKQLAERIYNFNFGGREFKTIDFAHPQARVSDDILYYSLAVIYQKGCLIKEV